MNFKNQVILITGGAAGIGKSTAQAFNKLGGTVVIWDLNEGAGNALVKEFGNGLFQKVDVTNYEEVGESIQKIIEAYGKIDVLINNAGITMDKTLKNMDPATWQKVIDVNLTGVFNCTQQVVPFMLEVQKGVILNASSVVGLYGNFGQTNYVATKAGVIGMTKTWARELGRYNIRVNAVAPGFTQTEILASVPEHILDEMRARTPLRRLGQPEDIANAYLFLASDEASFITGVVLRVDGGIVVGT